MNAPTSVAIVEKPVSITLAVPSEARSSAEKGSAASQHPKTHVDIDTDAERMKSVLGRMTSTSVGELEGLVSELHEVREFLKSEGERVQREITNYAQLNQRALAAIKIITETISPWKGTALESEAERSGPEPLVGEREPEKRASVPGANK